MSFYKATLEQLEAILRVKSLDRTPQLLITLDDTSPDLSATLIKINELVKNSTRYISDIAFINKSGVPFTSSNKQITEVLYSISLTFKDKKQLQLEIEKRVNAYPVGVGPYSDFFRSKENLHNQFGKAYPKSEVIGLVPATEMTDRQHSILSISF